MSTLTIILLISVIIVLGFIIRNLLKKVELYEEDIELKDDYIKTIRDYIISSDKLLEVPILKGAFSADDEVGDYFRLMQNIIVKLKAYMKNYEG